MARSSSLRFTLNLNGPTFGLGERAGKGAGLPQTPRLGRIATQEIGDLTSVQPMQNSMPLPENWTDVRSVRRRPPAQVQPGQAEEARIPTQPRGNAPILSGIDPVHDRMRIMPSHGDRIRHRHLADKDLLAAPGRKDGIHEPSLTPDDLPEAVQEEISREMPWNIRIGARPCNPKLGSTEAPAFRAPDVPQAPSTSSITPSVAFLNRGTANCWPDRRATSRCPIPSISWRR